MKTFWQFIEAINIPKHDDNVSLEQLLSNMSHRLQVQFALEMVEDAFHLNNDNTRAAAQQCIDLLKSWLHDPKQVTTAQLDNATNAVNAAWNAANAAVNYAATSAVAAATRAVRTAWVQVARAARAARATGWASSAAWNAARAYAYAAADINNNPNESIRIAKLRQYRNLAIHMQPTKSDKPHYINQNLKDLVQTALRTRDGNMFPIVWDAALDVDLLSGDMQKDYKHYEEHPFTFYHMLNQVIETK